MTQGRGNRLAQETSPYLIQHSRNPVDWYPWGAEALERAKNEDKPILLSVGYAACHWCHVMERESFENEEIAGIMNELFVCVKVDREERPDIDELYMKTVLMMTGRGGWPMTVFLTPQAKPFFGGTYFPPENRMGMAGFKSVLRGVAEAFRSRREDVEKSAADIGAHLHKLMGVRPEDPLLTLGIVEAAARRLLEQADPVCGGFGGAPKFPHPLELELLLRFHRRKADAAALECVRVSLEKMARGGLYDQLGGGFHRYSVDREWAVPHFEKMLYDNALLLKTYLAGYQATGEGLYLRVADETARYVLNEMSLPEGGFACSQDADSEGVEGKFFLWTAAEMRAALGAKDGALACDYFGVAESGNFEGRANVLSAPWTDEDFAKKAGLSPAQWARKRTHIRGKLLAERNRRARPGRDDKILSAWNGLMIGALAQAGRILEEPDYLDAAVRAATFLTGSLAHGKRLWRSYRAGQAKHNAYLEDYAFVTAGFLDLYEATLERRWIDEALRFNRSLLDLFWDERQGGFFFTSHDHETLIARSKSLDDGVVPSGNSVAVMNLLRLYELTLDEGFRRKAVETLRLYGGFMRDFSGAASYMICALDFHLEPPLTVVLSGRLADPKTAALRLAASAGFFPNRVVAFADSRDPQAAQLMPVLEGKSAGAEPAAFLCQNSTCSAPVRSPRVLSQRFKRANPSVRSTRS
ncbi:MAG: thioredoxin domain-containing protein [Elusimicrobia bacterium]|nr:thioredoxin domain-containing protein [Elusimicrobiota bacterium]